MRKEYSSEYETYLGSYGSFDLFGLGSKIIVRDFSGKKLKTFSSIKKAYAYIDFYYEEDPYHK